MKPNKKETKQKGFVLPVGLAMLTILTILGVSTMRGGILQERMAGNFLDKEKSFQASESALAMVQRITIRKSVEEIESSPGFVNVSTTPLDARDFSNVNFLANTSVGFEVAGVQLGNTVNDYALPPRAIIEEIANDESLKTGKAPVNKELAARFFRITAIGFGQTSNTTTTLQSVVKR